MRSMGRLSHAGIISAELFPWGWEEEEEGGGGGFTFPGSGSAARGWSSAGCEPVIVLELSGNAWFSAAAGLSPPSLRGRGKHHTNFAASVEQMGLRGHLQKGKLTSFWAEVLVIKMKPLNV